LVAAFEAAGLLESHLGWAQGNFFPEGAGPAVTDPCAGAPGPLEHGHTFSAEGRFGSTNEHGEPVDDGDYVALDAGLLDFPSHAQEFGHDGQIAVAYVIDDAGVATFDVLVPDGCSGACADAHAWAISAFESGPWTRVVEDTPAVAVSVPDLDQARCEMDRTGPLPAGALTIAARNDLGEPYAAAFDMFRLIEGATPEEFTAHMSMVRERVAAGDPYSEIVAIGYPAFAEVWGQVEVQAGEVGLLEGEAVAGTYMIECTTPLYVQGEFIPVAEAEPIVIE
jgi:hypothetical protein